jgi:hypothetical protein
MAEYVGQILHAIFCWWSWLGKIANVLGKTRLELERPSKFPKHTFVNHDNNFMHEDTSKVSHAKYTHRKSLMVYISCEANGSHVALK